MPASVCPISAFSAPRRARMLQCAPRPRSPSLRPSIPCSLPPRFSFPPPMNMRFLRFLAFRAARGVGRSPTGSLVVGGLGVAARTQPWRACNGRCGARPLHSPPSPAAKPRDPTADEPSRLSGNSVDDEPGIRAIRAMPRCNVSRTSMPVPGCAANRAFSTGYAIWNSRTPSVQSPAATFPAVGRYVRGTERQARRPDATDRGSQLTTDH